MPTNHTVTLTDRLQTVLVWLVGQINAERQSNLTPTQFLNLKAVELLQPFDLKFDESEAERVKQAYKAADAATKAEVKTELGL